MQHAKAFGAVVAAVTWAIALAGSARAEDAKYPDMSGQWLRLGAGAFIPDKHEGLEEQAPLAPQYQVILEASVASIASGGQGNNPMGACIPPGMPRTMIDYEGMEVVITPAITHVLLAEPMDQIRRIYTDGRSWPANIEPSFLGYSLGRWVDEDGDSRYDALLVETRALKMPHVYDSSGIPFHQDGQAVVKERISLDSKDANLLHDEITTIDHALTRPWTVTRSYKRARRPVWIEAVCTEENHQVKIGNEYYYLSADGSLMPTRKNQPPPDLSHFAPAAK